MDMPIPRKAKKNVPYFSWLFVAMKALNIKNGYRAYSQLYLPYKKQGKVG